VFPIANEKKTKYYQWTGIVEFAGVWYCIRLMQPNDDLYEADDVPDYWWPFINSLQLEKKIF
jgi:hypothetical protein